MGLVIKAALGALVVVLIGLLAKTKNYYIAGLIPLFPDVCVDFAHYIVASERRIEALRTTIIFSMCRLFPILSTSFHCGISPDLCAYPLRSADQWCAGAWARGC